MIKKVIPVYRYCELLKAELLTWKVGFVPPGHFYSPIISIDCLNDNLVIDYNVSTPGIDLNESAQFRFLKELYPYYNEDIFPRRKKEAFHYYFENPYFSYSDALFFSMIIRYVKPAKIIEVGSGFSSAMMLDINSKFFGNKIHLTFIEPYPEKRLNRLIKESEHLPSNLIASKIYHCRFLWI